jgi:uncharacterized iron-regulated membrane protein
MLVHRVNGLLLAGFLTVVGATGSLLAWNGPLERVFAPGLFVLPAHADGAERKDPVQVRAAVARAFPWAEVDSLDLSRVERAPLEFGLTAKTVEGGRTKDDEAYADPYSGRVLGSRRYGDLREGWKNTMPFVYELHQELALGQFGMTLLGLIAVLWSFDCFVGMYLSFPASRRRAGASMGERAAEWPRRWSRAWIVRWSAGGFKRLYDVHRASGVWMWAMLLVFAWSSVAFNLPGVYRPVMRVFGGRVGPASVEGGCVVAGDEAIDWGARLAEARGLMQGEAGRRGFRVVGERFLSYDRTDCRWMYRVRSTLDVDRIGNTQMVWASGKAAKAIFTAPTGGSRAETFTTWIEAMHESQIGGLGFRVLVCLSGAATALLSVTGVWIFLRKMGRAG